MQTVRKIDFFGGLHGNYLELVVNHAIDQNHYDITRPQFNENGACHYKNLDSDYSPITIARHYSFFNIPFNDSDLVIRISPEPNDMLIAVTNSFLRAGDQKYDIDSLETNTIEKLKKLPKGKSFLNTLLQDYGEMKNYPRRVLRNYFYSMFDDPDNGINMMTNWQPTLRSHNFAFGSFFNLDYFFENLQKISEFVNLEFCPTRELVNLHQDFLSMNQGYKSHQKCETVMQAIISNQPMPLTLNIIEEAWINYRISRSFNLYDVAELTLDNYPTNVKRISEICFNKEINC
jgi:hypothetical protein